MYPSNKIDIAGPIAYNSWIFISLSWFVKFISKSVNLIPSPVSKSANPWRDASANNFANAGISLTLKLSITNLEVEIPSFFREERSKYPSLPSSKPLMNLYLSTNGFALDEKRVVIFSPRSFVLIVNFIFCELL